MSHEDNDDLYDEEFDFVDDDDEEDDDADDRDDKDDVDEESDAPARAAVNSRDVDDLDQPQDDEPDDEPVDEYGRPEPKADYVVHIYEHQKLKRTIDRPFTAEDAEAFATEYNRTSKSYGRFAVAGKNDAKAKKALDKVQNDE